VRALGNRLILAVACGCLAGFGNFLLINSRAFASVLTPELALVGIHQLDTMFHASVANMLVKYGALSTGLDGLVPIQYHVLSHIWLGCVSLWLGVSTLDGYYIGGQVIAVPMLLFSLSLSTYLLRRLGEGPANGALITLGSLLLLFIADLWGWDLLSCLRVVFSGHDHVSADLAAAGGGGGDRTAPSPGPATGCPWRRGDSDPGFENFRRSDSHDGTSEGDLPRLVR
jgi:hypothetical protein